jgi:type III secretory pathway component EscU
MDSILERIRSLPRRTIVLGGVVAPLVLFLLVVAVLAPDELLGVIGLALYVVGVLAFSAAITFAVVKISPAQSAKEQAAKES